MHAIYFRDALSTPDALHERQTFFLLEIAAPGYLKVSQK